MRSAGSSSSTLTRAWRPARSSSARRQAKRRPCARTRTPSTQPPSRCSVTSRTRSPSASSACARTDRDGVRVRVGREHVQRLGARDAEAVALADGVDVRAGVLAEHAARRRSTIAPGRAPPARRGARGSRRGACPPGSTGPASRACARPPARRARRARAPACLRSSPSGKRRRASDSRRERGQHVALVLGDVDGRLAAADPRRPSASSSHARVVAGRERLARRAARPSSSIASRRTLPLQRTHGFGVSPAAWSASQPSTTPARNSARRSIERCGMPEPVRQLARAAHGLRRAAAELAVVLGVRPQLERHRDRVARRLARPAAPPPRCRRRRSSPRACARRRRQRARSRAAPPERAVQRVRGELGRVALGGAQPAELLGDLLAPIRAASQQRRCRARRPTVALPAAIVAPQPLASKPASAIRPSGCRGSSASEMRIRSPQAAPPAAPVKASGGRVAARRAGVRDGCSAARRVARSRERVVARLRRGVLRRSPVRSRRRPAAPVSDRRLAVLVDDQDRRRAVDLHAAGDRAERGDLARSATNAANCFCSSRPEASSAWRSCARCGTAVRPGGGQPRGSAVRRVDGDVVGALRVPEQDHRDLALVERASTAPGARASRAGTAVRFVGCVLWTALVVVADVDVAGAVSACGRAVPLTVAAVGRRASRQREVRVALGGLRGLGFKLLGVLLGGGDRAVRLGDGAVRPSTPGAAPW